MFVDESRIEKGRFTCVTGLVVPARNAFKICQRTDQLIKKYLGEEYSFYDGSVNLKWVRTTKYKNSPFTTLTETQQYRFTREVYKTLALLDCIVLCSIEKEWKDYAHAMKEGLYIILERFFYFLRDNESYGIVISDQPVSGEHAYKREIIELVRSSEFWGKKFQERIYQDVFFTRDEWDPLIQVTDLLAYTFSSYIRKCLKNIPLSKLSERYDFHYKLRENKYFKLILPLIRKGPNGRIRGYGIKC
jgi:hypothetical protein